MGRKTLGTCIKLGLLPKDKVLDIGAGSLRIGWWLVQYVEPSNYHAIEPVQTRIDAAAELLGVNINVYYNDDFEFPDIPFDFVLARSIWTHSSKAMISKMLAEFAENSTPDAKFLTSVVFAETMEEDYMGDEWVGKVLKSDPGGTVKHSKGWIREECRKHGLTFKVVGNMHWQTWLLIERAGRASPKAPQAS